jgi:hypothetical protein
LRQSKPPPGRRQENSSDPFYFPFLEFREGLQKGFEVALLQKHRLPIVAAVDHMIDQAVMNRSQRARHCGSLNRRQVVVKKIVLTRLFPLAARSSSRK